LLNGGVIEDCDRVTVPRTESKETRLTFKQLQAQKFSQEAIDEYLQYHSPWISELVKLGNKELLRMLEPNSSVLDIGCGTGHLFSDIQTRTDSVCGCDISFPSIELANKTTQVALLVVCDAENLPFHDKSFRNVILKGALHHFPDISRSMEEINRVLVPDGSLIISEPCGDTGFVRFMRSIFSKSKEKYFRSEELTRLAAAQFEVCSCKRVGYFSFAFTFIFREQIARLRTPTRLWRTLARATLVVDRVFSLSFLRNHNLGLLMLVRKRPV
jgi:ubiquinone/menaquinone biosynthesis C-methylase UbiE